MQCRGAIGALLVSVAAAGCASKPAPEPLRLEGRLLTVHNATGQDWTDVKIFLNTHYRVVTRTIPAGSLFQAPLDTFVEAYGRRFNFNGMQVHTLRLTATLPGGGELALDKPFQKTGLAGALSGALGRKE